MSDKEQESENTAEDKSNPEEATSETQSTQDSSAQDSSLGNSSSSDSSDAEVETSITDTGASNTSNKDLASDKPFNIPDSDPVEPAPATVIRPRASALMRTMVFFLICAIVLLAAALGGVVHYALKEKSQLDQQQAELVSRSEDMQRRFREFQNETHTTLQGFDKQRDEKLMKSEQGMQQKINGLIDQVDALSTTTETDWRLAEVEYLTRLASHRLYLAKDIYGARQLLETSAEVLASLADPGLLPVRQTLAEDLAKVKAASKSDDTALYLQLKALLPQVSVLPLFRQPEVNQSPDEEADSESTTGGWQSFKQSISNVTTRYFQIRRNTNIKPLLSSDEESLLRQLVSLKIEQAASALLQGKSEIYRSNLLSARELVADNFLIDEQVVIVFLSSIDELLQATINPEMPDISGSHQAVSRYVEAKHGMALKSSNRTTMQKRNASKASRAHAAKKSADIEQPNKTTVDPEPPASATMLESGQQAVESAQ